MKKSLLIDPLNFVQKQTTFLQFYIFIHLKLAYIVRPAAQNLNVLDSQWKRANNNDMFGILAQ